jgi:putative cell wall-binding protein
MRHLRRRMRGVAVLLASMLAIGGVAAPVAYAAESYNGGAADYPRHVMNDHTPFGFRFSALNSGETTTQLEPSAQYYVKVRLTTAPTPSSATNRGFTWNASSGRWVQEREAWTEFPTVTTNANGEIPLTWVYAKVGDENVSGSRYVLVSLSRTGTGSTFNPSSPPQITVMDAATEGSWVHNGIAMPAGSDNKRAAVRGPDSNGDLNNDPSMLYALWQTEANLVDDDGDGTIDTGEDWGPAGVVGDFRMQAPAETTVTVSTNRLLRFDDFKTGPVDCDIAVGADDMIAPSRVTGLVATAASNAVSLSWDPATDDGGSGLGGYNVYRWQTIAGATPPYTPAPLLVGTTAAGVTSFFDDTAVNDVEYAYTVRAVDADTNVGPRADTALATPAAANQLDRDWGENRYETALAISEANYADDSVDTVVIATGRDFPDALAASGLAGAHGSPLLLVGPTVTAALTAEIDRLGATSVALVGGEAAIPATVFNALDAKYDVERIWGPDRYATAAEVAREIATLGGVSDAAYFVRGDEFADALSVSPFAYSLSTPVLLVRTSSVPQATEDVIDELGVTSGWIAGGLAAVDADAADDLETLIGAVPVRWSGADRYATAAAVAQAHVGLMVADYSYIGIATGRNFADALGGGAAAGYNGGVLLLTQPETLSAATSAIIAANTATIEQVVVFGGEMAVSPQVYDQLAQLLE